MREGEVKLAKAVAEQARAEAELRVADAALANAHARSERSAREIARLDAESAALGDEGELSATRDKAASDATRLSRQRSKIRQKRSKRPKPSRQLVAERNAAQSQLAAVRAIWLRWKASIAHWNAHSKSSEHRAIDRIKVKPGYERALAAALGEIAGGNWWCLRTALAGLHRSSASGKGDRLANFVRGPSRTGFATVEGMIRVVAADDGTVLEPGERLVTLDGRLRRWDGFARG